MKRTGVLRGKILGGAKVGAGSVVEAGAVVGYEPSRKIPFKGLSVGKGARIRSGSVVYLGSVIGDNFETGHSAVIREENEIGDDVCIWSNTVVDYGCIIGSGVRIHSNVYVSQFTRIGDGAFIAPGAILLNDPHPGCAFSRQCMRGPIIGKNAVIGGGAVILPMVSIGEGALVGAGSVVSRDVPPGKVVYGTRALTRLDKGRLRCKTGHTIRPYPGGKANRGRGR